MSAPAETVAAAPVEEVKPTETPAAEPAPAAPAAEEPKVEEAAPATTEAPVDEAKAEVTVHTSRDRVVDMSNIVV